MDADADGPSFHGRLARALLQPLRFGVLPCTFCCHIAAFNYHEHHLEVCGFHHVLSVFPLFKSRIQ